jgi:NADP-dependent 3-hydroxy-3-methylglutaryl-CoA reductase
MTLPDRLAPSAVRPFGPARTEGPRLDDDLSGLRIPGRGCYDERSRLARLAWIRERTGLALAPFGEMRLAAERLTGNIENAIGAVEVPVGLAGPLLFDGESVRGVIHVPLATTEGALVASAARGATALTRAGGVRTRLIAQRMTRAPAFEFGAVREALDFAGWIADQLEPLRASSREVSRHAVLREVEPVVAGRIVHVLFSYTTGDAAGQNMTTATTWHACQWVLARLAERGLAPRRFLIEGNLSGDKKVSLHLRGGARGFAAVAECTIDGATLRRALKVPAEELLAAHAIVRSGAEQAGMVRANVNVANIVAAIFTATGQDIACVHESSLGELQLVRAGDGVGARLVLDGLVLGTVGGGTHLPAQRASLELMGCTGLGSARRLAEIVAGAALALELSTLAAITTGEFAGAHERLGRNRPLRGLTEGDLVPALFEPGLRRRLGDVALRVERVEPLDGGAGASILGDLATRRFGRSTGVFHRRLHHGGGATDVVVKVKPLDTEVALMLRGLATSCGPDVAAQWARFGGEAGFAGCHRRELAVFAQRDPRFVRHVPAVYDLIEDESRDTFALVLERLHGRVRLMDSADDPSGWGEREIEAALRGAGSLHAIWMGRERTLVGRPWLGTAPSTARMAAMRPLWAALARHAAEEFPSMFPGDALASHLRLVAEIPEWWARVERMPRTLAHNDFNPRNIALRDDDGAMRLCAYDWELATVHLPQHDAAELLAFVLPAGASRDDVLRWIELHRRAVAEAGDGAVPDGRTWREGFALAARDLLVNRFALYLMGHTQRQYGFLERALDSLRHLVALELEAP